MVFAYSQSLPELLYFLIKEFCLVQTILALWVRVLITLYLTTRLCMYRFPVNFN